MKSCATCRWAEFPRCTFRPDLSGVVLPICIQVSPSLSGMLEMRRHLITPGLGTDCKAYEEDRDVYVWDGRNEEVRRKGRAK